MLMALVPVPLYGGFLFLRAPKECRMVVVGSYYWNRTLWFEKGGKLGEGGTDCVCMYLSSDDVSEYDFMSWGKVKLVPDKE